MAAISLEGVRRVHADGTVALHDINLSIQDGHLFTIVGPSGSGKSTLLRSIAGLDPLTSGVVRIDGQNMAGTLPRDRDLALVAQQSSLYGFLDVAGQLAFPLEIRKTESGEVERRVTAERRAFRLGAIWRRRPKELSAGDAQRTAIARAMVRLPRALLLDEPLQLLDPPTQVRLRNELYRLHRASGLTMVYTTNDHAQVLGIADRLAVLRDGRIAQVDTPHEILNRPVDRWVAGFVGEPAMSFIDAVVEEQGGLGWLAVGDQRLRFPGGLPGPLRQRVGERITLGGRLDKIRAVEPEDPVDQRLDGVAAEVQHLGNYDQVTVAVPTGRWIARFPSKSFTQVGDRVQINVAVRGLSVFDAVGGGAVWHGG